MAPGWRWRLIDAAALCCGGAWYASNLPMHCFRPHSHQLVLLLVMQAHPAAEACDEVQHNRHPEKVMLKAHLLGLCLAEMEAEHSEVR